MSWHNKARELFEQGWSGRQIADALNLGKSTVNDFLLSSGLRGEKAVTNQFKEDGESQYKGNAAEPFSGSKSPRILVLDIETKYCTFMGWGMLNQNFGLEQIQDDWTILSFSAIWYDSDDVIYHDITEMTELELLNVLHGLLNEADFVLTHNGRRFDLKKIRARMIVEGFKPFSPVRVLDTFEIAKKEFGFTSNKLQYLTNLLCKKHVKSGHEKFAGFMLWKEFVKGNPEAIKEMRDYNILDVLSLRELYDVLAPWSSTLPVFEVYNEDSTDMSDWEEDGFVFSNLGKYQRYRHRATGQYRRGRVNLLSKEKRASLLANIV